MADDDDLDDAFAAYERSRSRVRSVLEVEEERITRDHPADEALQKHGGAIEEEILRALERDAEALRFANRSAEILAFPITKKAE